jgi:hypothetical protein
MRSENRSPHTGLTTLITWTTRTYHTPAAAPATTFPPWDASTGTRHVFNFLRTRSTYTRQTSSTSNTEGTTRTYTGQARSQVYFYVRRNGEEQVQAPPDSWPYEAADPSSIPECDLHRATDRSCNPYAPLHAAAPWVSLSDVGTNRQLTPRGRLTSNAGSARTSATCALQVSDQRLRGALIALDQENEPHRW